ncbi:SDR family NAD(P)-dependent oxidoreductase [Flavisphingomonas formosensis]|uniref:SDR family NAD(P)-dependent oxidoreductase n=1 Tax=Flavisphingomonas formosensis TaxID=861534 RepID=UPI0012F8C119|nr:SDR family NAD(P)-dependent oxidoreductase [Sphingomonas formosensis]
MAPQRRFGKRSTADEVLDGLDLGGKTILVTGCAAGIGLETARALAARGAHVIGTGRSEARVSGVARHIAGQFTPIVCDQEDFASVVSAAERVTALGVSLDAIIANAGIVGPDEPTIRYGVEDMFRVNHLSHMLLIDRVCELLREDGGRVVIVSSAAAQALAPREGILFDDLDGQRTYGRFRFYGQSKLANLTYAKALAKRLRPRGITVNALHPGFIASTDLMREPGLLLRLLMPLSLAISKTIPQGAATQCYLAVHPDCEGITGRFYADCRPAKANPLADEPGFQERLWTVSERILAQYAPCR